MNDEKKKLSFQKVTLRTGVKGGYSIQTLFCDDDSTRVYTYFCSRASSCCPPDGGTTKIFPTIVC